MPKRSRKFLMMMKAAKLGWAGAGAGKKQGWTKSRARKGRSRAGQKQGRSRNRGEAGLGQEQGQQGQKQGRAG